MTHTKTEPLTVVWFTVDVRTITMFGLGFVRTCPIRVRTVAMCLGRAPLGVGCVGLAVGSTTMLTDGWNVVDPHYVNFACNTESQVGMFVLCE